ncbi:unnamed protein product [Sphenostylis stenocarpa]|uniref:Telomerase reverse transcriptase n=1 Tax=Sphenostylis stenocarpa TaxID=92480 RepID=A0AA86SHI2_9FABA|nr:unnamed protein product [Sphenostylis stenocarpa]
MARKRNKPSVPGVLWRMFRHRARTLSDTITSLLPPPPQLCRCDGRRCLGCTLDAKSFLLRPDDPSDYRKLLTQCYIVVSENAPSLPFFVPLSGLPQDQVTDTRISNSILKMCFPPVLGTIEQMLHRREPAVSNVLCSGYDRSKCSSLTVELLSCAPWCLLLSRVGNDFMIYLLANTSIFLPAPHGKHHQVGGPPISCLCFDMLKGSRKFGYQTYGEQKRKRADADDLPVEKRKCHASYRTNDPLGFSGSLGKTDKSSMQRIRHHGSRNSDVSVSESPTSTTTRKLESEGKQGSNCITPKLGKRSRPFSWQRHSCKMQKQLNFEEHSRHVHFNVLGTDTDILHASSQPNTSISSSHAKMSLQCSCCLILQSPPAVPKRTDIKRKCIFYSLESSGSVLPKKRIHYVRDMCSANVLFAQQGLMSHWFCMPDKESETNLHKKYEEFGTKHCENTLEAVYSKSDAFKSYCSKSQVVSFIWAVSRSLLPSELLGQKEFKNWNDAVYVVKRKLLEKWIFWYFSCLVVPLLQANFYVTESEKGKQDIYYYPKPVWEKLAANTISCFRDWRYSYLDDVAVHNILRDRPFGFSKLRLQPKENGVRMVANLKGSSTMPLHLSTVGIQNGRTEGKVKYQKIKYEHFPSVNSVLRDAHTILKGILFEEPDKLGSSVFDYNDVYRKLCPFLVDQKKKSGTMPNLFIVTSDVLQAFDSIDQNNLLGIVKNILLKDEYFLKQYDQVVCTRKSLWVQKQLTMLDKSKNDHTRFTSFTSFPSRHAVFVNQERWKLVKKKVLFSYLMEHVKHNVLQFDGKFYLQDVGIPQGGILSPLLCSIYYGHLEKHVIFPFLDKTLESGSSSRENNAGQTNCDDRVSPSPYMLMRFIDDFLFISTSKKQADSFFSRLQRGFRGYNCYMNGKKFGANFDVEQISRSSLNRVSVGEDGTTSFIPWSGLLINCNTMEIQADYTKYLGNHLSSTLTVRWQGKPGINLKEKLCLFLRPKCHPLFFDSNINSAAVVRLNIYQVFLLCAMKFHCYIRDLSFICKLHKRYCSNIIQRSLRYMYLLIKKRMYSMSLNSDVQPILKLEKEEVEWLGFHAYVQVLKRKESRHKELLAVLRSRLSSHRMSGRVSPELKYAVNTKNSSLLWDIKY